MWVDKDSVPHYGGDPRFGEEYEEQALLGLESCTSKEYQRSSASKLKNALFGRTWDMTHKDTRISAAKLKELAAEEEDGPMKATKQVIKVV